MGRKKLTETVIDKSTIKEQSKVTLKELIKLGALSKEDINNAVLELADVELNEIRPIVNEYYSCQKSRIAKGNQLGQLGDGISPNSVLNVFFLMESQREKDITTILSKYCQTHPVLQWMTATKGVGPIIACMLAANLRFDKAQGMNTHNSHFWSYCGLNVQNNPWLGSDKARKSVKDIYDELDKNILEPATRMFEEELNDKKEETKFNKALKNIYDNFAMMDKSKIDMDSSAIVEIFLSRDYEGLDDNTIVTFTVLEKYYNMLKDYQDTYGNLDTVLLHRVYPNFVSTYVMAEVIRKHDRTSQKIHNGLKGIVKEVTDLKSYISRYSKESLIKYLSKMPYDEDMKTLCFKISDSFVKSSNRGSLYGRIYKEEKAKRIAKNNAGGFAEYASICLASRNGNGTVNSIECYKQGKLPDTQIDKQARRKAVQLFISHVYEAMYMHEYKMYPDDTYVIKHLGHTDYIGPEVDFFDYIEKPTKAYNPKKK